MELQMVSLGQVAKMLLEGVATGSSQFDGVLLTPTEN
jgi:hypothetical protein